MIKNRIMPCIKVKLYKSTPLELLEFTQTELGSRINNIFGLIKDYKVEVKNG